MHHSCHGGSAHRPTAQKGNSVRRGCGAGYLEVRTMTNAPLVDRVRLYSVYRIFNSTRHTCSGSEAPIGGPYRLDS